MKQNSEAVLKLILQEQKNNGIVFKSVIAKRASLLNIENETFEKIIQRLNWHDYLLIFGQTIELTEKGMNHFT